MLRYFFSIRYLISQTNPSFFSGRCISILHGFMRCHEEDSIGVCFPQWSEASLGLSIAFVCHNRELLVDLACQRFFKTMEQEGFINTTSILLVPDDVNEIRFVRNQHIAKSFPGEIKRRLERGKRRARMRGEEFKPGSMPLEREVNRCHLIPLDSKSSQQRYPLFIHREEANEVEVGYNSYGLASAGRHAGTVPDLSSVIK